MLSNFSFWIWGTVIAQLLTAIFHSISFFVKEKPGNETEKQLTDLVKDYKIDMGAGIKRSFGQLYVGGKHLFYHDLYIRCGIELVFFAKRYKSGCRERVYID